MIIGYVGLVFAFMIIAVLMLVIFLKSKTNIILKLTLISVAIWYSLVLFYTGPNLMGWPVSSPIPEKSVVASIKITQPDKDNKGGIYFWVLSPETEEERSMISGLEPNKFTQHTKNEPRAFKLPYSKELHRKIIEMQNKQRGRKGSLIMIEQMLRLKGKGQSLVKDDVKLGLFDPMVLPPKD